MSDKPNPAAMTFRFRFSHGQKRPIRSMAKGTRRITCFFTE